MPVPPASNSHLPSTQWTLISRLRHGSEQEARRALDDLCGQYRYPLYCYLRRRGYDHHDAEDILHDFLAKLLRNDVFASADATRGRLRCMLLVSLQRFTLNWQRQQRHRKLEICLEPGEPGQAAEERYQSEQFSELDTPDEVFSRKWTLELLAGALRRIGEDYTRRGKADLFRVLRPVLVNGGSLRGENSEQMAAQAGLSPGAFRVALMRMLGDYRDALKEEILQTIEDPQAAQEEFQQLRQSVSR